MTRFKELRRIELAIKPSNQVELRWALGYAEMRIEIATMKQHKKHWQAIKTRVQKSLNTANEDQTNQ